MCFLVGRRHLAGHLQVILLSPQENIRSQSIKVLVIGCLQILNHVPIYANAVGGLLELAKEAGDRQACVSLSLLTPSIVYVLIIFSMWGSGEHYHHDEKGAKIGAANRVLVMIAHLGHCSRTIH